MANVNDFFKKTIENTLNSIFYSESHIRKDIPEIVKNDICDIVFAIRCLAVRFKDSPSDSIKFSRLSHLADIIADEIKTRNKNDLTKHYNDKFSEIISKFNDILSGPDYPEGIKLFNEAKTEFDKLNQEITVSNDKT